MSRQFDKLIVEIKKYYNLDASLKVVIDKKQQYDELLAKAKELGLDDKYTKKNINNMFWEDVTSSFYCNFLKEIFQTCISNSDDDMCEQEKKKPGPKPGTKRKSITEPKSDEPKRKSPPKTKDTGAGDVVTSAFESPEKVTTTPKASHS